MAKIVTQKLYKAAHVTPFLSKAITIPVTFSTGIAEYTQNDTVVEFIHKADEMLYKSKEMGRNRFSG